MFSHTDLNIIISHTLFIINSLCWFAFLLSSPRHTLNPLTRSVVSDCRDLRVKLKRFVWELTRPALCLLVERCILYCILVSVVLLLTIAPTHIPLPPKNHNLVPRHGKDLDKLEAFILTFFNHHMVIFLSRKDFQLLKLSEIKLNASLIKFLQPWDLMPLFCMSVGHESCICIYASYDHLDILWLLYSNLNGDICLGRLIEFVLYKWKQNWHYCL